MADFKLTIADPKTGKTYQTEAKDQAAQQFIDLNIGEKVKGDAFGLTGFELEITGGSDYCGFPMRKGILGVRKRLTILKGIGFRGAGKGIRKRKTVCGHKIHDKISQINLKVVKEGSKKLHDILGKAVDKQDKSTTKESIEGGRKKEEKKQEPKPKKEEETKEEKKQEPLKKDKTSEPKEAKK